MLISSLLLLQPNRLQNDGVKYLHNHSAIVYTIQQQVEVEINCLMTVRDLNIMETMDEQERLDWLF